MILTLDIGNTATKIGLYKNDEYLTGYSFMTKMERTSDEVAAIIREFLGFSSSTLSDVSGIAISSVVPSVDFVFEELLRKYFPLITPVVVSCKSKMNISLVCDNPEEVGADRICAAAAAYEEVKSDVITMLFGTASCYDYIDKAGRFCAAITSPGIKISADALWGNAAKLPQIDLKKPESILAKNTITSVQAGVVYGYLGQVEYIIAQIEKETGVCDIPTIATGGYANVLLPHTKVIKSYDPLLIQKGLKLIYDSNK